MSGLPSLRYPAPAETQATPWAADWRRRWFRHVGSVHQHHATGELVAFYSDARDPSARLALQAEIDAQLGGVAQVLAVCRAEAARADAMITGGAA
ncbi:hypothetical protein [Sphingomonas sp. SRS2]|uniref:hypothetical protein n=1 Tax=Sphingomonas sp. SRS2 TaxID=133190 RepID=UPI0006183F60|nr:hypothetical protein [Sphingomonas sp. SRS2]KKC27318.1 hypothetical protein WP12_04000 [Sphingomonas sp. SRS2]